jgi:hypothetical protein
MNDHLRLHRLLECDGITLVLPAARAFSVEDGLQTKRASAAALPQQWLSATSHSAPARNGRRALRGPLTLATATVHGAAMTLHPRSWTNFVRPSLMALSVCPTISPISSTSSVRTFKTRPTHQKTAPSQQVESVSPLLL